MDLGGRDQGERHGCVEEPKDKERPPAVPDLRHSAGGQSVEKQCRSGKTNPQLYEQERTQRRHGDADKQEGTTPQRAEQDETREISRSH
jgi:hypothetical protein